VRVVPSRMCLDIACDACSKPIPNGSEWFIIGDFVSDWLLQERGLSWRKSRLK
jgi:hypothetical protein